MTMSAMGQKPDITAAGRRVLLVPKGDRTSERPDERDERHAHDDYNQ